MKALAYALVGLLLVLAAPSEVAAEAPESNATGCNWFDYSVDPPAYKVDVDCLLSKLPPLPP